MQVLFFFFVFFFFTSSGYFLNPSFRMISKCTTLCEKVKVLVTQLCPTLCNPMDCNPPGYSVYGILQARILEQVAIPFSRKSPWPRDIKMYYPTSTERNNLDRSPKNERRPYIKRRFNLKKKKKQQLTVVFEGRG